MMKTAQHNTPLIFGFPDVQKEFAKRNQAFLKAVRKINEAQSKVIDAASKRMQNDIRDKIIYLLSRQVYEDFDEILLLCANGLSTGAMKILRGMFERTVTVCYLQRHPEEIELYSKYYYVRRRKEANAIRQVLPNALSTEMLQKIESEYQAVKPLFQVPVCEVCKIDSCKPCNKTRDSFSWLPKDIIQMARQTGNFEPTIYHGYYIPLQEAHPTAQAITHRVKATESGKWDYVEGPKPELDNYTLMVAHFLVLRAVEVVGLHFKLRIKGLVSDRWRDFVEVSELTKGGRPKVRRGHTYNTRTSRSLK